MLLDSFVFTSAGGRGYNEDAALAQESADGGLYLVADGLGGHAHSEQAAQAVIESLGKAEAPKGEEKLRGWLEAQLENANEKVLALQRETHLNMKSTLAALLVRGARYGIIAFVEFALYPMLFNRFGTDSAKAEKAQ